METVAQPVMRLCFQFCHSLGDCATLTGLSMKLGGGGRGAAKAEEEPVPMLEQNNAAFLIVNRINVALLCATSMMSI